MQVKIVISNSSDQPIYAQIKKQIEEQILSGRIKENEVLPSIRQLARDLSISVITTTRAYRELENDGFITTVQGKGSIVLPQDSKMIKEQYLVMMEKCFQEGIYLGKTAGIEQAEIKEVFETLMEEE